MRPVNGPHAHALDLYDLYDLYDRTSPWPLADDVRSDLRRDAERHNCMEIIERSLAERVGPAAHRLPDLDGLQAEHPEDRMPHAALRTLLDARLQLVCFQDHGTERTIATQEQAALVLGLLLGDHEIRDLVPQRLVVDIDREQFEASGRTDQPKLEDVDPWRHQVPPTPGSKYPTLRPWIERIPRDIRLLDPPQDLVADHSRAGCVRLHRGDRAWRIWPGLSSRHRHFDDSIALDPGATRASIRPENDPMLPGLPVVGRHASRSHLCSPARSRCRAVPRPGSRRPAPPHRRATPG